LVEDGLKKDQNAFLLSNAFFVKKLESFFQKIFNNKFGKMKENESFSLTNQ